MPMFQLGTFILALLPLLASPASAGASASTALRTSSIHVTELKTEHLAEPLAVETPRPRFRWLLESSERGQLQTAYQVLVASSLERLQAGRADKWDSGKVLSDNSVEISYAGRALVSGERAYWQVRIWDQDGRASGYSSPSFFEMGLLKSSDWQGQWIAAPKSTASPLLRRDLSIDAPVRRARVYVSGLGFYELSINGQKVGDRVLDPAPTYYHNDQPIKLGSRVLYATYDVASLLRSGENALGVMLGHGWYSPDESDSKWIVPYSDRPKLILQMNIELTNGRKIQVVSDSSWKTASGPITYNSLVHGETYDARLEQPDWNRPGFNDSSWQPASAAKPPTGRLTSQLLPPQRVTETLPVARVFTSKEPELFENTYTYDFGQVFTGWVRIALAGPRGAKVVLKYGSRLYPEDDTLDNRSNVSVDHIARQTDTYILKGEGIEIWEPRFTLHGFRYVEVRIYLENGRFPVDLRVERIEGRVVHSAVEPTGSFFSSNELIHQIHHNIHWTFRTSLQGLMQDASERAERVPNLGDPSFVAEDYIHNFDMIGVWEKWLNDFKDSQTEDGSIPYAAPYHNQYASTKPGNTNAVWPSWQSTYPLLAWYLYQYYGDRRVLEEHYPSLKRFVAFLSRATRDDLLADEPLGDHMEPQDHGFSSFAPRRTPAALTANAHYYQDVRILAQMAEVLRFSIDAQNYRNLAGHIKDAFNRRFLDPAKSQYATGSQTSNALPLYLDMVPREKTKAVLKNLIDDIVKYDYHVTTGIIGSDAVVQVLPKQGAADVMYRLATQTSYPSLGHQVTMGATAVCESYECGPWLSQNMKMFGSLDKFFYRDLAGISPARAGYSKAILHPQPVGDLKAIKVSQKTVRGTVGVEWHREEDAFDLKVSIPTGMIAEVTIPINESKTPKITESQRMIWTGGVYVPGTPGLMGAKAGATSIDIRVGSGAYDFRVSQ